MKEEIVLTQYLDMNKIYHFVVSLSFVHNCKREEIRWEFEANSSKGFADEFLKRFGNIQSGKSDVKEILRSPFFGALSERIRAIDQTTKYTVVLIVNAGRIIIK